MRRRERPSILTGESSAALRIPAELSPGWYGNIEYHTIQGMLLKVLPMLLIVPLKFCNLAIAISGEKKRRPRVDNVGIRLYSARIGSIRVPAYGRGVGQTCTKDLFLALEKQAIAGPVFQIHSRQFELQEVVDQLHLLLFVRVSSRHSSNGPDCTGQDNQSDQDKCHTAEPFCCPSESQFPQVSLFQTRESPERPENARRSDQQANQVACAPRFQP